MTTATMEKANRKQCSVTRWVSAAAPTTTRQSTWHSMESTFLTCEQPKHLLTNERKQKINRKSAIFRRPKWRLRTTRKEEKKKWSMNGIRNLWFVVRRLFVCAFVNCRIRNASASKREMQLADLRCNPSKEQKAKRKRRRRIRMCELNRGCKERTKWSNAWKC